MPEQNEPDRLAALYRDFTDDQLLDLREDRANLTDDAQYALDSEIRQRRLTPPSAPIPPAVPTIADGALQLKTVEPEGIGEDGLVELIDFSDGFRLADACRILDEAGIPLTVKDPDPNRFPRYHSIRVDPADEPAAQQLLHEHLGEFLPMEVDGRSGYVDDGAMLILGDFEERAEAERTASLLASNGIACNIFRWRDRYKKEEEEGYSIEVRAADLDRGLELVVAALGADEAAPS